MSYYPDLEKEFTFLLNWLSLRKEQGADLTEVSARVHSLFAELSTKLETMPVPAETLRKEPNDLQQIKAARPDGPRKLSCDLTEEQLYDRLLGAWLGRSAGCVLGLPVEGWTKKRIEEWARVSGQEYPLTEYWKMIPENHPHYNDHIFDFLLDKIDRVANDDDISYTVLGLLVLEAKGADFTSEDVADYWVKHLPIACTAEAVALENLKHGLKLPEAAMRRNPYVEWIGADIRSDPWGYAAPGLPELAAEFAYRDARVSHIGNGVYGEMLFSAAIAAALVIDDPIECIKVGLTEIPAECRLAETIAQTLDWCEKDGDLSKTQERILTEYANMHPVHTNNNAALTVAGLYYADGDFDKSIAYTVMGGLDTDCTGATCGSIIGAIVGAKNIPEKWVKPFNDRLVTYLLDCSEFKITDLASRSLAVAKRNLNRF